MEQYKRRPNTNCLECNKAIYRRPYQIKLGPVFCSQTCSNARFRKPKKNCPICKKLFCVTKDRTKTCSRVCSNKSRAGIKYLIGRPNDKQAIFSRLKNELIKLRGPKCEYCSLNEENILIVHHIKERYMGGNNEYSNLKLLCPNCHARIHYGKMGEPGLNR